MTTEQILKLASNYLRYFDDGWRGTEYSGEPQDILKFALAIHENGYNKGYDKGCEDGYESAKMNPMEGIYD